MKSLLVWGDVVPTTILSLDLIKAIVGEKKDEIFVFDFNFVPQVSLDVVQENFFHISPPFSPTRILKMVARIVPPGKPILFLGIQQIWNEVRLTAGMSKLGWNDPAGEPAWSTLLYALMDERLFVATASAKKETIITEDGTRTFPMYPEIQPSAQDRFSVAMIAGNRNELLVTKTSLANVPVEALYVLNQPESRSGLVDDLFASWSMIEAAKNAMLVARRYANGQFVDTTNKNESVSFARFLEKFGYTPDDRHTLKVFSQENQQQEIED